MKSQYVDLDFSQLKRDDQDLLVKYILKKLGVKLVEDRFDYHDTSPALIEIDSADKVINFRYGGLFK